MSISTNRASRLETAERRTQRDEWLYSDGKDNSERQKLDDIALLHEISGSLGNARDLAE